MAAINWNQKLKVQTLNSMKTFGTFVIKGGI